ncbi:MAG: hypothetical protein JNL07_03305, partial [Rhodospirillales bacterium]|nr:hypothetical protein [Rhodospirillales bacterium]
MRKLMMAGAAVAALFTGTAQAQVQQSGFFGSIDGFYWFTGGSGGINSGNGVINGITFVPGDGWGGSARLGYRFDGTAWDVALGGKYGDLKAGKRRGGGVNDFGIDDAKTWNVDLEVGYNITGPGWGVRPMLGVRYQ